MAAILEILKQIGSSILMALLTESFLKHLVVKALEYLAKKTSNEVDDELVAIVKKALEPSEESK